ncbi:hypothetical protein SDC9_149658 [bioreactor metagenome]|uniref:Uncharacterized protein n=1 Tax=bioreactor metagenome TaxID=1076179 RepID=A0A645EME1_9ZZZZ
MYEFLTIEINSCTENLYVAHRTIFMSVPELKMFLFIVTYQLNFFFHFRWWQSVDITNFHLHQLSS